MVSAGLAGKWGSFVRCCPGKPERCGRTDDFFKLSLGGFKGWAQSDSVQIDQPRSKTAHGQECCKFFNFVRIKAFHGKGLGFWVFGGFVGFCLFVCFLELSNFFFFVLALVEQFAALRLNTCVFSRSPCCRTGQKLWSLLCPHDFVPCPDPMSISWSLLQLHFLKVPAGEGADAPAWTKRGHHSWRAAGPSPAPGEEALAKSNIPKHSVRLFLPKILHMPLQVWAGLKKNLGLCLESDGWFEAHSLENDD